MVFQKKKKDIYIILRFLTQYETPCAAIETLKKYYATLCLKNSIAPDQ